MLAAIGYDFLLAPIRRGRVIQESVLLLLHFGHILAQRLNIGVVTQISFFYDIHLTLRILVKDLYLLTDICHDFRSINIF